MSQVIKEISWGRRHHVNTRIALWLGGDSNILLYYHAVQVKTPRTFLYAGLCVRNGQVNLLQELISLLETP